MTSTIPNSMMVAVLRFLRRDVIKIPNTGNTCYANVAMQLAIASLRATDPSLVHAPAPDGLGLAPTRSADHGSLVHNAQYTELLFGAVNPNPNGDRQRYLL